MVHISNKLFHRNFFSRSYVPNKTIFRLHKTIPCASTLVIARAQCTDLEFYFGGAHGPKFHDNFGELFSHYLVFSLEVLFLRIIVSLSTANR